MTTEFDQYAGNYATVLNGALSATGESNEYFAFRRVHHFAGCLSRLGIKAKRVLDFGCGTGSTSALLLQALECETVVGIDPSNESIVHASRAHASTHIRFFQTHEYCPGHDLNAAYCNGVFHHIPLAERSAALRVIRDSLRPGGILGLWENNPWNPGTRYVMSQCAFDENAITISPRQALDLVRSAAFEILRLDFLFFFPRTLRWLRPIEPVLKKIPFGGQYQVLCRRPG